MRKTGLSQRKVSLLHAYSANLGMLISRKRSEEALRAASMESALANRAKSEFLANMSHELRTPLNAIIGFSQLLQKLGPNLDPAKTSEYAGHISKAGNHLLNIVVDILDMSKIESGSFRLNPELNSIPDIVDASLSMIKQRIAEKKQRIEVFIPEGLPALRFDERRVKQICSICSATPTNSPLQRAKFP